MCPLNQPFHILKFILEKYLHKEACVWMFLATFVILAKNWRQSKYLLIRCRLNKLWSVHLQKSVQSFKRISWIYVHWQGSISVKSGIKTSFLVKYIITTYMLHVQVAGDFHFTFKHSYADWCFHLIMFLKGNVLKIWNAEGGFCMLKVRFITLNMLFLSYF